MLSKIFAIILMMVFIYFLAIVVWASQESNLIEGFAAVLDNRWGVVSLVDLYSGFLVLSGWIAVREKSKAIAAVWIISLFILGNLISLPYAAIKCWNAKNLREAFLGE